MVPHMKVEEKLHEAAGVNEITFAVTGLPDPKKGERLVVLHTLPTIACRTCSRSSRNSVCRISGSPRQPVLTTSINCPVSPAARWT